VLVDQKREQLNIIKNLKNETFTFTQESETQYTIFASVDKEYTSFIYQVKSEAS